MTQYNGRSVGQVAGAPCPTITADVRHTGIVAAHLHQYNGQKGDEARGVDPADPVLTVTPDPRFALVSGFLARFQGDRPDGSTTAGRPADAPAPTATARSTQTMVASAFLGQVGHRDADRPGPPVDGPLNTILAKEHHLAAGVVLKHYGGVTGHVPGRPLGTITAADHHSVAAAAMVHMNHGDKQWGSADAPLRTVLAGANHHGLVRAFLEKYNRGARGMSLADPLLTATSMDRFGLVRVEGEDYAIVDITLRMLTPRELFRCQGFPDDYRIDVPMSVLRRPRKGRPPETITRTLPKSGQVRMVGNSVPPPMSEALVRANFPEECRRREPARPARPRMRRAAQGVA